MGSGRESMKKSKEEAENGQRRTIYHTGHFGPCLYHADEPVSQACHIIPHSSPMSQHFTDEENIIPLCPTCHYKFDKFPGELPNDFLKTITPKLSPTQDWLLMLWLLGDYPKTEDEEMEYCYSCWTWFDECGFCEKCADCACICECVEAGEEPDTRLAEALELTGQPAES